MQDPTFRGKEKVDWSAVTGPVVIVVLPSLFSLVAILATALITGEERPEGGR